jgi:uncharacterized protein (TIGR02145 family)
MVSAIALSLAVASPPVPSSRRMPDGKRWTTQNLNVDVRPSYCYGDAERNCRRFGRLYPWEAARQACQSLGDGWRLPTDDEWQQLAKRYGGVRGDSNDEGRSAYRALSIGGHARFNAALGGNRSEADRYERLHAHGFYWTASDSDSTTAWFYNFGRGGLALNRHRNGDKRMAVSVRCISD